MSERPDIEKMDDWEAWETDDDYDGARELIEYIHALEAELADYKRTNEIIKADQIPVVKEWEKETARAEKAETERDELKEALGTMAAELIVRGKIIDELEAELARHHLTNGCPNTYHNEGCADSHRTVCEYR